ncbi:putative Fe-Mo cluster-binding NifX family protein [Caldanaerobacter subterraneus subsp. tengcongensis MB4]|uniref:Dinitrogenase iron-molybdenum cofactor biosynthesis domain-containing protein n=2 Tax=Caldanaerobacter subterraneus TaxID=911092 RepID=Q8RDC1_CALS4|nr:NifB/NifX family molybdenum-iron cluster-binding protein [Caldanaerobacter subterraneus]AAM23424.1 conserved hypothetical protein [Caldanaerobacter subterraneus subsp. tengcongensis MB4]KKC30849.1 hypothetical protein CDSM653_00099 [Caldanaerobacter subterraneus subsp. pacificus DSM 12653]MBE3578371.1 NifB/NifX family molybdenum-iron cluster-binding protein [Caldanaerobacter subterraneus]MCS3917098.1 putative Fe-Mo cluster-binding NifX family protein [Caldanaerobacter subterraneus subsp. ten
MRIAATITEKGYIEKLPDGPHIVIFDTEKNQTEKYDNPGYHLEENRRSTVVDFLFEKNVDVVITVPEAFCSISYGKARQKGLKFIRLKESMPYEEVIKDLSSHLERLTDNIPEDELFKRI